MKFFSAAVCALAWSLVGVEAVLDDFYCGDLNCYDVLGVASTAKPKEIQRAYRAMAKTLHPDVRKNEPDNAKRAVMEDEYLLLNKAYDTLKKVDDRKEYDAIIADNFRYRVLKRKYYGGGQNIYIHPVAPLILVLIAGSILQKFNRNKMMESEKKRCIHQVINNEKWLDETTAIIKEKKCESEMAALKEKNPDAWAKKALELNPVEIVLHVKPVTTDEIFAVQAVKFPLTAFVFITSFISNFGKREKLTKQDKITKTANAFGLSEAQLIRQTDKSMLSEGNYLGDLDELLKKKLWKSKNMNARREEEMKQRLRKIPKHRRALARKEMEEASENARMDSHRQQFEQSFGSSNGL